MFDFGESLFPGQEETTGIVPKILDKSVFEVDLGKLIFTPLKENYSSDLEYLRAISHSKLAKELIYRLATNPALTTAERSLGFHQEGLEPEVREAVMSLREKGYQTLTSGYGPIEFPQYIEFSKDTVLNFGKNDCSKLKQATLKNGNIVLGIKIEVSDNMESIKNKW